jgi:hypothetical protein
MQVVLVLTIKLLTSMRICGELVFQELNDFLIFDEVNLLILVDKITVLVAFVLASTEVIDVLWD